MWLATPDLVSITQFRALNADRLRELRIPMAVTGRKDETKPLAVLMPFELFMRWQEALMVLLAPKVPFQ
jgi:hypothetical protein